MSNFKISNLFSNVGGFNKAFKASENHEKHERLQTRKQGDYNYC